MTLRSEIFYIGRGGSGLDSVNTFILQNIEYDSFLIKNISASSLNDTVTILTITYNLYDDEMIHDISPRENYILTTGINSGDYGLNILFSHKLAPYIFSGAIVVDGTGLFLNGTGSFNGSGLPISYSNVDSYSNSYSVSIGLSGFTATGSHFYFIDNTKIFREDNSTFSSPAAGGYTIHSQSSAYLGEKYSINKSKIRGKISIDLLYLNKSIQIQNYINDYLLSKNIQSNNLVAYSTVSRSLDQIELYICYVADPEPQIITGYPSNHSLLPIEKKPKTIFLTFSTELDNYQITSQADLFGIISGSGQSVSISPEHISLLPDKRTAIINIESYITTNRVYTIIARPGIISSTRFIKQKPDFWTIVIDTYEGSAGSGDANMNDVMRRIAFRGTGA
jgi:hypothetical protein